MFVLCILCLILAGHAQGTLTLQRILCDPYPQKEADACWLIDFNNHHGQDIIFLKRKTGSSLLYYGTFLKDPSGICDAVGNPHVGTGPLTLFIRSTKIDDTRDSCVHEIGVESNKITIKPESYATIEILEKSEPSVTPKPTMTGTSVFARNEKLQKPRVLKIAPIMDSRFISKFKNETGIKDALNGIFCGVQTALSHPSSFVKFKLQIQPLRMDKDLNIEGTEDSVKNFLNNYNLSMENFPEADMVIAFSARASESEKLMITQDGNICSKNLKYKTAFVNYFSNVVVTAQAVTHAISNLLGVGNDYLPGSTKDNKLTRYGPGNISCTNEGGFMDLVPLATRWSLCSRMDMKKVMQSEGPDCVLPGKASCPVDDNVYCPVFKAFDEEMCMNMGVTTMCKKTCDRICGTSVMRSFRSVCTPKDPSEKSTEEQCKAVYVKADCMKACPDIIKALGKCFGDMGEHCCRYTCRKQNDQRREIREARLAEDDDCDDDCATFSKMGLCLNDKVRNCCQMSCSM